MQPARNSDRRTSKDLAQARNRINAGKIDEIITLLGKAGKLERAPLFTTKSFKDEAARESLTSVLELVSQFQTQPQNTDTQTQIQKTIDFCLNTLRIQKDVDASLYQKITELISRPPPAGTKAVEPFPLFAATTEPPRLPTPPPAVTEAVHSPSPLPVPAEAPQVTALPQRKGIILEGEYDEGDDGQSTIGNRRGPESPPAAPETPLVYSSRATLRIQTEERYRHHAVFAKTGTEQLKELFHSPLKLNNNFYANDVAENIIHLNRIAKEISSDASPLDRRLIQNCFKHLFQEITREDSTLEGMLIEMRHDTHTSNVLSALYCLFASPDTLKFVDEKTYPLFEKAFEKIDHACAQQNNNEGTAQWGAVVQLWDNSFKHTAPKIAQAHSIPLELPILTAEEVEVHQQLIRAEKQIQFLENPENQRKFLNGAQVLKLEGLRNEYNFVSKRFSTITERVHTKENVLGNVKTFSKKVNEFYTDVKNNPKNAREAHGSYWGGAKK